MLGERLKQIRNNKGLTQKAFAKPLSTSSGYISEVEQGKKSPGSDFLLMLSRVWGVSIDWLLTGKGNPYIIDNSGETEADNSMDDADPEVSELMAMTREIIESNTNYAHSLTANIRSFHQAMTAEYRYHDLEKRLSQLENRDNARNTRIRETDPKSEAEAIIKRRAM